MGSHQPADIFIFSAPDDHQVFCRRWPVGSPRAVVQLVHGGAEHSGRYEALAERLNDAGYAVYAEDHRGHGRTGEINTRLGDMGAANAFERVCNDVLALGSRASVEYPGIPLVLLGHSLGSLIAQRIVLRPDQPYHAVVLSGSPDILQVAQGADLVHAEVNRVGRHEVSEILEAGIVEGFAAAFPDAESPHAWLSRDDEQLRLYEQDRFCGFPLSTGAWQDLISAMLVTTELPALAAGLRKDLPVYVLSGTADPVHNDWTAIERLEKNYRACALEDITVVSYPEGRHEMFNETNREQVIAALITWLGEKVA